MKGGRPPPPRKGIKVTQHNPHPHSGTQLPLGEVESVRSSRSRGISMSRESGITLDRIYDHKHFPIASDSKDRLNIKPIRQSEGQAQTRTLLSYKSLDHIPLNSAMRQAMEFQNLQEGENSRT